MKKYYCYLARCSDNSLYTGSCVDLEKRQTKHNNGTGAKYTASKRPVKIVYFEEFATLSESRKREIEIKKWPKKEKEDLIKSKII